MQRKKWQPLALGVVMVMASSGGMCAAQTFHGLHGALDSGDLGLHATSAFRLTTGQCKDCSTIPQALWYFRDEVVAVPTQDATGFSKARRAQDDVVDWAKNRTAGVTLPPLAWIGSPLVAEGWHLDSDSSLISNGYGEKLSFSVTGKIPSNLAYYDATSQRYFAGRSLSLRGRLENGHFTARTIWPDDLNLRVSSLEKKPLAEGETLYTVVRAENGGARLPLASRLLWQRDTSKPFQLAGKPILAFMLNGAQGDDDEAHGGHFAIATGRFGPQGEWRNWLVNNFYNLDSVSEKGIVAATLPMDTYMADINSGQSWYRPSYMLVAVLKDERAPAMYQQAISRVFNHFYRHDFSYRHATSNCAGISIGTLRSLGWQIPRQGATSTVKAIVGLPYMAVKDRSLESGRKAFDYMSAETTDLYPFVAFEAAGRDILERIVTGKASSAGLEGMLAEDIEALVYVRIPQFPSSRAFGRAPVASFDEYMARVPEDKSKWQVVPVPPRPFPEDLKDRDAPGEEVLPSTLAVAMYGGFFGVTAVGFWRRRGKRNSRR